MKDTKYDMSWKDYLKVVSSLGFIKAYSEEYKYPRLKSEDEEVQKYDTDVLEVFLHPEKGLMMIVESCHDKKTVYDSVLYFEMIPKDMGKFIGEIPSYLSSATMYSPTDPGAVYWDNPPADMRAIGSFVALDDLRKNFEHLSTLSNFQPVWVHGALVRTIDFMSRHDDREIRNLPLMKRAQERKDRRRTKLLNFPSHAQHTINFDRFMQD